MTILTEAYDIAIILCHKKIAGFGYDCHQGYYKPDEDTFQMLPRYTKLPTKKPSPGIADMTWIDDEDKVMICRYPDMKMVEVRQYIDHDLYEEHVEKIKEIEGIKDKGE